MKKNLLLFLAVAAFLVAKAQPKAVAGTSDFQHTKQPAAIITVACPEDVVEKAIDDYMARKGLKGGSTDGYKVFRNYKLAPDQDHNSDLYFKVNRKNRSEKDLSMIYLITGRSTEDIKTRKLNDSTGNELDAARDLLDEMVPSIEAYGLEVQVKDQEDVVKKAQKKYDGLVGDQKDAEKKIRNLKDKLAQNKLDQSKQGGDIQKYGTTDSKAMLKAQKKLNGLIDDEADYEKSLKNTMDKLEQNRRDQESQQAEIDKQQSILDVLVAKRK